MPLEYWLIIHLKKVFMEKEKKKAINILIVFFISHKSDVKIFLKWILNQCRTALVNMTQSKKINIVVVIRAITHMPNFNLETRAQQRGIWKQRVAHEL